MNILRRNYDLVASVSTAGIFLAVGVPGWLWAIYAAVVTLQIGNRIARGWAR